MINQCANTRTMTAAPAAVTSAQPCGVVIPTPPEEACCQVSCLVQPRFFCGQLLTDADLQAMIAWSQQKFGLARYRDGWGVACGLNLRLDPNNPTGVILSTGYAVDCCGNDILVCADAAIDLTGSLPQPGCDDQRNGNGGAGSGAGGKETYTGAARLMHFGGEKGQAGQKYAKIFVLDLLLHYGTLGQQPQNAMGVSACAGGSTCEYSRTLETFQVEVRKVKGADAQYSPRALAIRDRQGQYHTALMRVMNEVEQLSAMTDPDDALDSLNRWLDMHPLEMASITLFKAGDKGWKDQLYEMFYTIISDYHRALLRCRCFSCEQSRGVRLGRVIIGQDAERGIFRIIEILASRDYRWVMEPGGCGVVWPGCIDTGPLLFESPNTVTRLLMQAGFAPDRITVTGVRDNLSNPKVYREYIERDVAVLCPDLPVEVYGWQPEGAQPVVVGFYQQQAEA